MGVGQGRASKKSGQRLEGHVANRPVILDLQAICLHSILMFMKKSPKTSKNTLFYPRFPRINSAALRQQTPLFALIVVV
jgi:hypothetical protein